MKEDIAKAISQQTSAALDDAKGWSRYGAFVGLDVHKDTIAVAIAMPGCDEPVYRGEIAHEPKMLKKWLDGLNDEFGGAVLLFRYEARIGHRSCSLVIFQSDYSGNGALGIR